MNTGFHLFPPEASSIAPRVDSLALYLVGVTVFFTALIFFLLILFVVLYRKRPGHKAQHVHPAMSLEIAWSVIPFILVTIMFFWGVDIFVAGSRPPAGAMTVYVVGKQWMWHIQHPEGRKEINELHVPLGVPIRLIMTSQDVIHDFGLPDFRIKRDVVPGMYTEEWFTPTELGQFHLFCDQYCGAEHANMKGTVYVMTAADYQDWLTGGHADEPMSVSGAKLFAQEQCTSCHGQWAPTMAGLYMSKVPLADGRVVVANDDYIRRSIIDPAADVVEGFQGNGTELMPTFRGSLTEEQIEELIEYIKSLGPAKYNNQPTTRPGENQGFQGGAEEDMRKPGLNDEPPIVPRPEAPAWR